MNLVVKDFIFLIYLWKIHKFYQQVFLPPTFWFFNVNVNLWVFVNKWPLCWISFRCKMFKCVMLVSDTAQAFSVVVFHCRHMFHKECLPSPGTVSLMYQLFIVAFYSSALLWSFDSKYTYLKNKLIFAFIVSKHYNSKCSIHKVTSLTVFLCYITLCLTGSRDAVL